MFMITGLLIQLAIIGGIAYAIGSAVRGRSERSSVAPGGAISIRRLFQYALLLAALVVAAFGVGGLLSRAISDAAVRRSGELAGPLALTVTGVPVFSLLGRWIWQHLKTDPEEQGSVGWGLYINVVLLGSLITAVSAAFTIADGIINGNRNDGSAVATFVVATAVWLGHWVAWRRIPPTVLEIFHLMAGSAIGLGSMAGGAGFVIGYTIHTAFEHKRGVDATRLFDNNLKMALVAIGIGGVVWSWHWLRNGLHAERTTLWHAYVILFGVLGGLTAAVTGGAFTLFLILTWLFGDPDATTAAAHFQDSGTAIAASTIGLAVWLYHRAILGFDRAQVRTDIDRIYDYLVSGVALVTVAGALTTLIVAVMSVFESSDAVSRGGSDVNIVIAAITLLLVGGPIWAIAWRRAQTALAANPDEEGSSSSRRIYLFAVFGIGGSIAFGALIRLVFVLFEAMLGERSGATLLADVEIPIALLATTSGVAAYHWSVYKAERTVQEPATWRNVTMVWAGGDVRQIEDRSHVRIRSILRTDIADTPSPDAIVAAIDDAEGEVLMVVVGTAGVEVIPVAAR
jgi:hypothetical protein